MRKNKRKYYFLDLFSGCGGFSTGLKLAGFTPSVSIDIDMNACKTYRENSKITDCHNLKRNLFYYRPKRLENYIKRKRLIRKFDVIIGGPPCQGWSVVGRGKIRSLPRGEYNVKNDARNKLYKRFVDYVNYFRPKCFVMENVPGMLNHNGKNFAELIKINFQNCGYSVTYKLINAFDYGVPQVRKRLFFVGFRNDLKVGNKDFFLRMKKHPGPTVKEAIGDLPVIRHGKQVSPIPYKFKIGRPNWFISYARTNSNGELFDHITRWHNEQDLKAFNYMTQGMQYHDLPKRFKRYNDEIFKDKYKKLFWNKPSWTLTAHLRADCYTHIHPSQRRTISVREAARLQSFPDDFKFVGGMGDKFKLVGNAVPPLVALVIGVELKKILKKCKKQPCSRPKN